MQTSERRKTKLQDFNTKLQRKSLKCKTQISEDKKSKLQDGNAELIETCQTCVETQKAEKVRIMR